jgi:hypothetical protein
LRVYSPGVAASAGVALSGLHVVLCRSADQVVLPAIDDASRQYPLYFLPQFVVLPDGCPGELSGLGGREVRDSA